MKHKKRWAIAIAALLAVIVWIAWGNTALTVHEIKLGNNKIPRSFAGFRIAQVSDLHNASLGKNNASLVEALKACEPDLIVLTGDLIDSYHTDMDISLAFARQVAEIAPTYFVTGNHEARIATYREFLDRLADEGVVILQNEAVILEKDGAHITLIGVDDPSVQTTYLLGDEEAAMDAVLSEQMSKADGYTILLSHRPELFPVYVSNRVDLVFSGHAHGGQVRLPFIGGIVAPGQGFFPKYDAGLYTEGSTNMVVSRGVGNSIFPFRVNNRPELVVVELQG